MRLYFWPHTVYCIVSWLPGRFTPITCLPRVDSFLVVSPRKVSWFAPLNRYYIKIDEVFSDNFGVIIYLLVVCKKNNNSFILVYFNYLFISCIQKNNNSSILVSGILLNTKGRIFFSKKNHREGVYIHLCV